MVFFYLLFLIFKYVYFKDLQLAKFINFFELKDCFANVNYVGFN